MSPTEPTAPPPHPGLGQRGQPRARIRTRRRLADLLPAGRASRHHCPLLDRRPRHRRHLFPRRDHRTRARPRTHIRFVDPPLLSKLFQRETTLCRRTVYYTGYKAWQRAALQVAKDLHREKPFDLIHQLNMTGYREPGYLWKIDAPFVWGPVGGAANYPDGFTICSEAATGSSMPCAR